MTENMQKFIKLASENSEVQAQLAQISEAADNELAQGIIALAKANGIDITTDDLKAEVSEELSDDELDQVAGGKGGCFLVGAGGGRVCVVMGTTPQQEFPDWKDTCVFMGF